MLDQENTPLRPEETEIPQALLPEGARFVGVGTLGEDDAYLFLLRGGRARRARPRAAGAWRPVAPVIGPPPRRGRGRGP